MLRATCANPSAPPALASFKIIDSSLKDLSTTSNAALGRGVSVVKVCSDFSIKSVSSYFSCIYNPPLTDECFLSPDLSSSNPAGLEFD